MYKIWQLTRNKFRLNLQSWVCRRTIVFIPNDFHGDPYSIQGALERKFCSENCLHKFKIANASNITDTYFDTIRDVERNSKGWCE